MVGVVLRISVCAQFICVLAGAIALSAFPSAARGDEAVVAVAANFAGVMKKLETDFEAVTGQNLTVSIGSTGGLYAQIRHGAPYDVLLAADQRRPALLAEEGLGVPGSRFTYAVGILTLWSADAARIGTDGAGALTAPDLKHVAIASPRLAPYGAAAMQTLKALDLWATLKGRIVRAENVAQAFSMVATGNAELGFVALSHVLDPRNKKEGSRWEVPAKLHAPIRQDAILLKRGAENQAACAFLTYLKRPATRAVIADFGYRME